MAAVPTSSGRRGGCASAWGAANRHRADRRESFGAALALGGLPIRICSFAPAASSASVILLWNLAYTELYFTDCLWRISTRRTLARVAALRHAKTPFWPDRSADPERRLMLRSRILTALGLTLLLVIAILYSRQR